MLWKWHGVYDKIVLYRLACCEENKVDIHAEKKQNMLKNRFY